MNRKLCRTTLRTQWSFLNSNRYIYQNKMFKSQELFVYCDTSVSTGWSGIFIWWPWCTTPLMPPVKITARTDQICQDSFLALRGCLLWHLNTTEQAETYLSRRYRFKQSICSPESAQAISSQILKYTGYVSLFIRRKEAAFSLVWNAELFWKLSLPYFHSICLQTPFANCNMNLHPNNVNIKQRSWLNSCHHPLLLLLLNSSCSSIIRSCIASALSSSMRPLLSTYHDHF